MVVQTRLNVTLYIYCLSCWKCSVLQLCSTMDQREAPSSSQLVPYRLLYARPLMMSVFRASTNCPTDGLFDPQCKRIAPNVFSWASWFRFLFSRNLNLCSSLTFLHTCWTAPMEINQSICEGGGCIGSDSLLRKVQVFTLSTALLQYSMCLLVLVRWQRKSFPWSGKCVTPMKLSNRSSKSLTNIAVARHLLYMWPEKNITNMFVTLTYSSIMYEWVENFSTWQAVHIMSLLKTFILTCSHMSIYSCSYSTAHYLCS